MGRSGASYQTPFTTTAVKTGTYTAAPWDLVRCDATSAGFTVTLPAASTAGQQVAVKLLATSGTNTVTVARAGSDTINNAATTIVLTLTDEAVVFTSNGAGVWTIAQGRLTLASMDARFASINDPLLVAQRADRLTVGEFIPDRKLCGASVAALTQSMALNYFTADKTETITTITAYTGGTAAGATPTLCRYGVYSVAANGDISLIASTPNDTTMWSVAGTAYPKALSASWSKVVGTRYAIAILQVTSATAATFVGIQMAALGAVNTFTRTAPAVAGRVTGQSDLPNSVVNASITGYQAIPAFLLS